MKKALLSERMKRLGDLFESYVKATGPDKKAAKEELDKVAPARINAVLDTTSREEVAELLKDLRARRKRGEKR